MFNKPSLCLHNSLIGDYESDILSGSFESGELKKISPKSNVCPSLVGKEPKIETFTEILKEDFDWNLVGFNPVDYGEGEAIQSKKFPSRNSIKELEWSIRLIFEEPEDVEDLNTASYVNDLKVLLISHMNENEFKGGSQVYVKVELKVANEHGMSVTLPLKRQFLFEASKQENLIGKIFKLDVNLIQDLILEVELMLSYDDTFNETVMAKKTILWRLNQIEYLASVNNEGEYFFLELPKFKMNDSTKTSSSKREQHEWMLVLYPQAKSQHNSNSISLFLYHVSGPTVIAHVIFTIFDRSSKKTKELSMRFYKTGQRWNINDLLTHKECVSMFPSGTFTIRCEIKIIKSTSQESNTIAVDCLKKANTINFLSGLFIEQKQEKTCDFGLFSLLDICLVRMHKIVLFSSSKIFLNKFIQKGNKSKLIEVKYSKQCILDFVEYLYMFGLSKKISTKNLFELFNFAIDYMIENLIEECEDLIIRRHINLNTVYQLLDMREMFLTKKLKEAVFSFLDSNFENMGANEEIKELLYRHSLCFD